MTDPIPGWVTLADPRPAEAINTEGVAQAGELTTRVLREAEVEIDFQEARARAAADAYRACQVFAEERIAAAGPYDDTRALQDMVVWLGDKIREAHSNATNGIDNASSEA